MIIEKTENGIYKMLDLSELPTKKWGNKEKIDWDNVKDSEAILVYGEHREKIYLTFKQRTKSSLLINVSVRGLTKTMHKKNLLRIQMWFFFCEKAPQFMYEYLVDKEYMKLPKNSSKRIKFQCPTCGERKTHYFYNVARHGFACAYCRATRSLPERVVNQILKHNSIMFIQEYEHPELSRRRFDFFLPSQNIFIEVHGEQHFRAAFGEEKFKKTKESDAEKRMFCKEKGYKLIEIDASQSNISFILSQLSKAPIKLEIMNRRELEEKVHGERNFLNRKHILKMYEEGSRVHEISLRYGISTSLVYKILNEMGANMKKGRKVVNMNSQVVYQNPSHAHKLVGLKTSSPIHACCKRQVKSAGKHPVTGEKLKWMYYEDYVEKYGTEGLTEHVEEEPHN